MALKIFKHPDGYWAYITPPSGRVEWASSGPMSERELTEKLYELGGHLVDIWDMLAVANPEIRKAQKEAQRNTLVKSFGEERVREVEKEVQAKMREEQDLHRLYGHDPVQYRQKFFEWVERRQGKEAAERSRIVSERVRGRLEQSGYQEKQAALARQTSQFIEKLKSEGWGGFADS